MANYGLFIYWECYDKYMSTKSAIWICVFIGSIIGGYIPVLFGQSFLSMWSLIGNGIGGLLGIWIGFKIGERIND
jgi:hypothetical protein